MKPWLWLPPKWSHSMAPLLLPLATLFSGQKPVRWKSLRWKNLDFINPLGIAGGVDKEGSSLLHWQQLGAGFLEVGTITPKPQGPNSGLIIDRDPKSFSLWNKMGFPNAGAESTKDHLLKIASKLKVPLLINIGKNRNTDNKDALRDYKAALQILAPCSNTFVINISSPNTSGLRDLQQNNQLKGLLAGLRQEASQKNLLLKLSPDLSSDQLKDCLDIGLQEKMDGFILTNTTLQRPLALPYPQSEGGVSGEPLKLLSRQSLMTAMSHLGENKKDLLIISAGGILDSEEVMWRLNQGADLIQVYSALIYSGPFFFRNVVKQLWH